MTPNQLKLAQAANKKRSKELDARESYLNEQQALLDSAPIDIKVLGKTILTRENELKAIKDRVIDANKSYVDNVANNEKAFKDMKLELEAEADKIHAKKHEIAEAKAGIAKLAKDSSQLEQEITERRAYLKTQEDLIAKTAESGNEELLILKYQVEDLGETKSAVVGEIAQLNRQKSELENSLFPITEQISELQVQYEEAATNYRTSLQALKSDITKVSADYKRITTEIDEKMKQLRVHEEEIMAKRAALNVERRELDTEKRRFSGTKSLYKL